MLNQSIKRSYGTLHMLEQMNAVLDVYIIHCTRMTDVLSVKRSYCKLHMYETSTVEPKQ